MTNVAGYSVIHYYFAHKYQIAGKFGRIKFGGSPRISSSENILADLNLAVRYGIITRIYVYV